MNRLIKTSVIILTVIFLTGVVWFYAHRLIFYRITVLEVPVRFEKGFSLNREFTVDIPADYWVAIQYEEIFRSTVEIPVPRDEFAAESEVASQDKVIAKGGTARGGPAPWASNRNQVTRYLNSFHAEPGKRYSVSVHITDLLPGLVGKNPKALVEIEPGFTLFYDLRKSLFIYAAAGIGIVVILLCVYIMLRARRTRRIGK
jgi:hypothetical protein